jgi:RNA polymerase sigma-70 factor, ECF subfamily
MRMPIDSLPNISAQLAAARTGSTEALGQALSECRSYLLQIARRQLARELRAKGGASDLVQETFLEAQQHFDHFHGTSTAELRAWLSHLLRHRAAKFGRRYRTTAKRRLACEIPAGSSLPADIRTPSVEAADEEQLHLIRSAIAHLPDDYRRVMTLRYEQGLKFEEIGRQLGRSADAVRMLWARALQAVKHELRPPQAAG